jgi:hypothetical protein
MFFRNMSVTESKFTDLKTNFRIRITEAALCNIISDIPTEWLPSDKDINTLIEYLLYRINHLNDICITIINHLKH